MRQSRQSKIGWQYLAGFYDGEGTIGFRVVKEKRLPRISGELEGWYISPYLQIANTNIEIMKIIQNFLQNKGVISHIVSIVSKVPQNKNYQKGYYLTVQSYDGIKKFLKNISPVSMKKEQIKIVNDFFKVRNKLPILKRGTKIDNLKRNCWTKELFLKAMKLRDELKNTKFRKNTKHKYNYDYFQKLWG